MIEAARRFISDVERKRLDLRSTLSELRSLSLDEFGELLMTLPNDNLPYLSSILPRSTPAEVQKEWTGSSGGDLLRQSTSFLNFVSAEYSQQTGKRLADSRILDFGVGWGRLARLLPYYTNPENIYGVDAWEVSLDHARKAGVLGNLAKSDAEPKALPFPEVKFNLIFAFSIFTHLSATAARACLEAMRKSIADDGLLIITLRAEEFWPYLETQRGRPFADQAREHRDTGYAFVPSSEGANYGETSMSRAYLQTIAPGWAIKKMGTTFIDPQQVFVTLLPS